MTTVLETVIVDGVKTRQVRTLTAEEDAERTANLAAGHTAAVTAEIDAMTTRRVRDRVLAKLMMEVIRSLKTGDVTYWDSVTDAASFRALVQSLVEQEMS